MSKLLVCDIDGTLLGREDATHRLLRLLRAPNAPVLAFASGRQGHSAMDVLLRAGVTGGAYLIAGVGSELYRRIGKQWVPVAAWPHLERPWDAQRVRQELLLLPDIRPQPLRALSAYKLSYFAHPSAVSAVRAALQAASIDANIVHSHGDMLDVLPRGIDKGAAVAWLAKHLGIALENVMTCGNTANDVAMLELPCAGVIVGGCDEELLARADSLPQTYVAREPCAAGIIEGLRAFGWLNESDWRTTSRCL
ncbi:MAG TPA: HAD-IIB family hydrolase [Candidatus Baltobacteraceae bacterium]|nr:HAD-IIB family hydrolase [Candidatus Baltobacteraceae bacterium]